MKRVLIVTYYWPPSGGSGVQRWMYFAKYLSEFGVEPYVITVDEKHASYKVIDESFREKVAHVKAYRTSTLEPLRFYSRVLTGNSREAIPHAFTGEKKHGIFQKISRYIRGNFFIPDARIGWNKYAVRKAKEIIRDEKIDIVITTGPPHSSHLIGLRLKKELGIKWISDFRDPWTEVYYNSFFYRTARSEKKDKALEKKVLQSADLVLTIGNSMQQLLQSKIPQPGRVKVILNGYDAETFKGVHRTRNDKSTFLICHIGVLGDTQPVTAFLKAVLQLFSDSPELEKIILLRLVGNVSPRVLDEIKNTCPQLRLEVLNYVPYSEAVNQMMNADLLLNSLAETKESKLLISGKLMEYVASGNTILCLGDTDGDAAHLLNQFERAAVLSRNDIGKIKDFLGQAIRDWEEGKPQTVRTGTEKYSRYECTRQLAEIIKES